MTQYKMSSMKEERMQMQNAESVVLWPTLMETSMDDDDDDECCG